MYVLTYILVVYSVWLALALLIQRAMVFPRHFTFPDPNAAAGVPDLVVNHLETEAGPVETWFIPAPGATPETPAPVVLFAHGNAELIEQQDLLIIGYRNLGVSVMLVEFRGYGRSSGSPTQANLVADFKQAREKLITNPLVDADRILYHGRSIGTGVTCALADEHPPAAMVLTAPYTSLKRIFANYLVFGPFVLDKFDNTAVLEKLDRPVLILHGKDDVVIPHAHSKKLVTIARDATLIEFDCGHNDIPIDEPRYWNGVRDFLVKNGVLKHQP
ncbi:MAG: alpha/beta hydrolase [Planctomycetota bacterium]|jgi:pimeloyl-ACP methyl ester carboxylesterase